MIFTQRGYPEIIYMEDTDEPAYRLVHEADTWLAYDYSPDGRGKVKRCPTNWFLA